MNGTAPRLLAAFALAAASVCCVPAVADEDPPGRVGRVAEVAGDVRTLAPDGASVALPRNEPLATGDRVITGKDGRATLQVGSSTLHVGPSSEVAIAQLDDQKIRVHFDHGQLALRVRSNDILGELSIETDEGLWVPHHPGQFRFDRLAGQVLAAQSWSGDMLLEAPDSSLPVAAQQRAEVWREGAQQATHYRLVAISADKFSDGVLAQDGQDDRLASASLATTAAGPMLEEMTGVADLARYGQWRASGNLGNVWIPTTVPAGWAPYRQGSWAWIAPWGWTWMDDTPWGFAPFHYGRWLSLQGRWAWAPGRWTGRPVYAPALVGWLGDVGAGGAGGAPLVGWLALAPGEPFYPGYAVSPRGWSAVNDGRAPPPASGAGRSRFEPVGPIPYANRLVPGAVALVPASALLPRVPVSAMAGMPRADRQRPPASAIVARAQACPPPGPPPGRAALVGGTGRVVRVPTGAAPASR